MVVALFRLASFKTRRKTVVGKDTYTIVIAVVRVYLSRLPYSSLSSYTTRGYAIVAHNAQQVYDPEGTGFMDPEILRKIFDNLGFGEMSDGDLKALLDTVDDDGDGRLGIEDFRRLCDSSKTGDSEPKDEPKDGLEDSEKTQTNGPTISA